MPKYHELVESRSDAVRRSPDADHLRARRSDRADRWGAAIAGTILFAVPVAGGLYRGSFDWMDVVVGLMGFASLAVAVNGFARDWPREAT
jgi:hypothetical protein